MGQLIVNADDFGYSAAVNEGILAAHQQGIVTSTTVMVNLDFAAVGIEQLLAEAPELGLGLHINLSMGKPITAPHLVASLVDDTGYFNPIEALINVMGQWDADELYEEIAAQIERFVALAGKLPTHLDAHYHLALMHPAALEATLTLAAEHRLPVRETPLNRLDSPTLVAEVQRFMPDLPAAFINPLLDELRTVLARAHPPYCPAQFDARFVNPHNTLGDLLNILTDAATAERPIEVMCHPGQLGDPAVRQPEARQRELDALRHPTSLEVVSKLGIELTHFGNFSYLST